MNQPGSLSLSRTQVIAEHDDGDLMALCHRFTGRLGERGHLFSSLSCALTDPTEIIFLDVETMGLWGNVIFLVGLGRVTGDSFVVEQYLAPTYGDEPEVLRAALADVAEARVVVTYNGRTADVPWLQRRSFYFGLGPLPDFAHVDLMYGTRRRFQRLEPRLETVRLPHVSSELLGLPRPEVDLDSALIPAVYAAYAEDPDALQGLLVPVLEHNRADLEALVLLLEILCAEALTTS